MGRTSTLRSHWGDPRGTTRKHCLGLCLPGVGKEEAEEIGLGGWGPRGALAKGEAPPQLGHPAPLPHEAAPSQPRCQASWTSVATPSGPLCVWHGRRWGCAPTHSFAGVPWSSPAVESCDIIANLPVVVDNRSGVIRTGFTGDQIPKHCFPNFTGPRARVREAWSPGGGPLHQTGVCWPRATPWSTAWCGTGMTSGSTSAPRTSRRPSPRSIPCL